MNELINAPVAAVDDKGQPLLDRLRYFKFDVNAHEAFERESGGKDLPELYRTMALISIAHFAKRPETAPPAPSIGTLKILVWAGLIHEDETLTPKQVGAMMKLDTFEQVAKPLAQSLVQYFPSPQKEQTGSPNLEPVPTKAAKRKRR